MLDWNAIDTVLFDMDGTLIDLKFDNVFWNELLPERYARVHGVSRAQADTDFAAHIDRVRGKLDYYCIDAWARFTRLPVRELKAELSHLIRYRPYSLALLDALHAAEKDVRIVTNAHADSIEVKQLELGIRDRVAHFYSAHEIGYPKESQQFWRALTQMHPFCCARTLLIDDTQSVLDAAREHGIAYTLAVTTPDSSRPKRDINGHRGIDSFDALLPVRPLP